MLRRLIKGQSTAEYAIVIGLVLAAAIGMQVYVKRGIQGKIADASDAKVAYDDVPNNDNADYGVNSWSQYEPTERTVPAITSTSDSSQKVTTSLGGKVRRELVGNTVSTQKGTEEVRGAGGTN